MLRGWHEIKRYSYRQNRLAPVARVFDRPGIAVRAKTVSEIVDAPLLPDISAAGIRFSLPLVNGTGMAGSHGAGPTLSLKVFSAGRTEQSVRDDGHVFFSCINFSQFRDCSQAFPHFLHAFATLVVGMLNHRLAAILAARSPA